LVNRVCNDNTKPKHMPSNLDPSVQYLSTTMCDCVNLEHHTSNTVMYSGPLNQDRIAHDPTLLNQTHNDIILNQSMSLIILIQ